MNVTSPVFARSVQIPSSKSAVIRAIVAASLCRQPTRIVMNGDCGDIRVAAAAVRCLGAKAEKTREGYTVTPGVYHIASDGFVPDFEDCATALRIIGTVAAKICPDFSFVCSERLRRRVGKNYAEELRAPVFSSPNDLSVTSQTLSGKLFLLGQNGGTLITDRPPVSRDYVALTVRVLRKFGVNIEISNKDTEYSAAKAGFVSPGTYISPGDWSCAAFPLIAGLIGKNSVTVRGLDETDAQADRDLLDVLENAGGQFRRDASGLTALPSRLGTIRADAGKTPDLIAPLCAAACSAGAAGSFSGVSRLETKESKRLSSLTEAVRALGGVAEYDSVRDILRVHGPLHGGVLPDSSDHRIVMTDVLFGLLTEETVTVPDLACCNKSYPDFPDIFRSQE